VRPVAGRGRRGWSERCRLGLEIVLAYARARRALHRDPIAEAVSSLRGRSGGATVEADPVASEEARRLGAVVTRVLRLLPGDTRCLVRSLVLTQLLARRGIESRLVIGARAEPDFLAHAWVEHRGDPVLDPGGGEFARLTEL
jgi:hypothetical protein